MASFHIPEIVTDATGTVINDLESLVGSVRRSSIAQVTNETPVNEEIVHTLSTRVIKWLIVPVEHLTLANRNVLKEFIEEKAIFKKNSFDFVDDAGETYYNCKFGFSTIDFIMTSPGRYKTTLLIRSEGND